MKFKVLSYILFFFMFLSCNTGSDFSKQDLEKDEEKFITYTIKYNNNGFGQNIDEKVIKANTLLTPEYLPILESEGMFFRGWLINGEEIDNNIITSNILLDADWCDVSSVSDGICTFIKNLNRDLLKDIGITTIYVMDSNPNQSLILSNLNNIDKSKQKIKLDFSYCNKMKILNDVITDSEIVDSIVIPKNVKTILYNNFHTSGVPKPIYYKGDISDWCNMLFSKETRFHNGLYINNMKLEGEIVIPEGVVEINPYVFYGFSNITAVIFPNSLKKIGKSAFVGDNLAEIYLSDNIEIVDDNAFVCCNSSSIHLSKELKKIGYCSFQRNNFISLDFSNTKLETITEKAFYGCEELESVIISDNISVLGKYCFYDCKKLNSVNISKYLQFIDEGAFWGCTRLNEINFLGKKSEWELLEKSSLWNEYSNIKKIQCSDGIIYL